MESFNHSFNQAQTVLNWDPSSLEIKTRSVEKTLEPLVMQVKSWILILFEHKQARTKAQIDKLDASSDYPHKEFPAPKAFTWTNGNPFFYSVDVVYTMFRTAVSSEKNFYFQDAHCTFYHFWQKPRKKEQAKHKWCRSNWDRVAKITATAVLLLLLHTETINKSPSVHQTLEKCGSNVDLFINAVDEANF